jgi:hypothetical protein
LVQYTEFREISRNSAAFWLWNCAEFRAFSRTEFQMYFMVIPRFPSGVKNIIIKLLQKFHCMEREAWAAPGRIYTTGASSTLGLTWTTDACAAPGSVYTTWIWAAPGRGCTTRAFCWSRTCLYYTDMCCTWTCRQNRDLHLDVSGQLQWEHDYLLGLNSTRALTRQTITHEESSHIFY